jgi:hypothetical protein
MKRQRKFQVLSTPEFLHVIAKRATPRISQFGWRPSQQDLAELRASTGDARAYRAMLRSWRRATGFKVQTLRKLAGRPAPKFRTQSAESADAACISN